ncbi:NAD-dependent malic enzyme 59 kDa isoform, mitochondrial [Vitis vinifera]|uniref:NAD-dependent malic enzyme 59 kDa isoform, mitochondrial n=1 Tax=Vitis vinifera TaxID=29760 RepID=A0A438CXG5_VITVI|nr:NAD-dependent malic enzyme 59 kDa isoform, mitochondrial [Vitis vinifera]
MWSRNVEEHSSICRSVEPPAIAAVLHGDSRSVYCSQSVVQIFSTIPWFNKDTGFPLTERDRLGLRGLLPPRVISFEHQYARFSKTPYLLF